MAHYVLSDIHGEAERFHAMLDQIAFSAKDTLYILGDVVDRGADGIALLREIMQMPNAVLLLGNHEYMMLQYLNPDATEIDIRRWNKNGNAPTLAGFHALSKAQQEAVLSFLRTRPTHLELSVGEKDFYLVHGFPAETVHDEVWHRPELTTPNPCPNCTLIVGHTPVVCLLGSDEAEDACITDLAERGEHMRIAHCEGFIDIDCGCGHKLSVSKLACIRLEDMQEFYA